MNWFRYLSRLRYHPVRQNVPDVPDGKYHCLAISDCEMHFLVGKFIVSIRTGKNADLKDIIIPRKID